MSNQNTQQALKKEYITNCAVCNKFIHEDLQSSVRKYCSYECMKAAKRKGFILISEKRKQEIHKQMQEEINNLSLGKEKEFLV